ncbi:hypothetical protein [Alteromonas australica]|uniref:Uncharacterized protein n=1 Tax=Alteromonas australica TaxID=589873 RepID=A0A075NXR2_9ALTE|nr:hypothetical protein [Alteromonas australica]AIF98243.1 hypothetical protein EP13_05725 [Alteromonas australica]
MNQLSKFLTIVVSTLSLISFCQQVFDIGLSGVFANVVEYYRFVINEVLGIFRITLPQSLLDLWTLSFLGAAAYVKSDNIEGSRLLRDVDTRKFIRHWKIIYFFCLGISFFGLGILLTIIYPLTYVDELQSEPANLIRSSARNVIFIVLGLFVFFVLNAYAPSL